MTAEYKVHTAHETTVTVPSVFDGITVQGQLPAVIVELVGTQPFQRSITHIEIIETPDKAAAARKRFPVGATVVLDIKPKEGGQ